jgi:hypothetical protein
MFAMPSANPGKLAKEEPGAIAFSSFGADKLALK